MMRERWSEACQELMRQSLISDNLSQQTGDVHPMLM